MKIRSLLVATALVIALVILVLQRSQISKLTADLQSARQTAAPASETRSDANTTAQASAAVLPDQSELLHLRAEVSALRKQTNELTKMRAENEQIRAALARAATATQQEAPPDTERAQAMARLTDSKIYGLALIMHFEDNQQRFATNMDELAPYLSKSGITGTNDFDIMFQGSREGVTNVSGTILVREHQPRQRADGRWTRAYGFLDGHSELHAEPTSNFDDFEREHLWPARQ